MPKKIQILGGGIAGLTAGIYAQKMGFESHIYEQHSISGGECTGWDRQGFHIDGCIHWLAGTKGGSELGKIWRDIGALGADAIHQPDRFCTAERDGVTVSLYCDIDKLQKHLTMVSPPDKDEIDALCEAIHIIKEPGIPTMPPDMMNPLELFRLVRGMSDSAKIMKRFQLPLADYVQRFHHPAIQQALVSFLPASNSAYILPYNMGVLSSGNGGRPAGGSRALARRMTQKYTSMGGEVHLGRKVKRIEVEKNRATGISFSDGTKISGDYLVPTMDTHIILNHLLEGRYPNPKINLRDNSPLIYPSLSSVYVAFGIDADLSALPQDLSFSVNTPFLFEGQEKTVIPFRHYCYEPDFAPPGKSVGIVLLYGDYDWWENKYRNPDDYRNEKKRLSKALCSALEQHFPELTGKIRPLDVATPMTYKRYCGAWRGAWMSYGTTPNAKQMIEDGRIKGVDNLFMAGQWLMPPGGLTIAMLTGKSAIQRLCKKEKLPWRW